MHATANRRPPLITRLARTLGISRLRASLRHRHLDGVIAKGSHTVLIDDKPVVFLVSTRREAIRVVNAVGEQAHIESVTRFLRDGDVFWDIGANIGMFTCAAAALHPGAQVHAFEPEPRTAARVRENIARNKLPNASVHEVALSDSEGSFEFIVAGELGSGTNSLVKGHANSPESKQSTVTVRVCTPADYARERSLAPPTVVKCDVEGAEAGVIRGLMPWIQQRTIRRLDVEFHISTLESQGESAADLEREILARGYRAETRHQRGDTLNITFLPA